MNIITRSRLTGLTGAASALVLTATLMPAGVAYAAPAARPAVLAAAASTPASLVEKAAALRALEIEPTSTLTGLNDCDLSIAIWQRLDGKAFRDEVRAAAVAAFSHPDSLAGNFSACSDFIRTGVTEAKQRDLDIEVRVKEQQRVERELKQKAALTIGIVADPDMLALDLRNFVDEIRKRATGEQVRAAALAAYDGTDADRATFLSTGIVTAYEADRLKEIHDGTDQDLARQQKLIEDAARRRAMAVLLQEATPGMLEATDRDFITYIWENAEEGTEVRAAAEAAVLSRVPADWNAYIHTGIHEAREEDRQIALRKKYEADRAAAEEVLAAATKDGYQVLALAAKKALAGTPTELDTFVRRDQYELDLVTGFGPDEVQLSWTSTAAWAGGINNVNGCSVLETKTSQAVEASARAQALVAKLHLTEAQQAVAAAVTAAEKAAAAVKLAKAQAEVAAAAANTAAAAARSAACAGKTPENVVVDGPTAGNPAVRYFGVDHDATSSFAYFKAISLSRIVVKPTTTLSYRVWPEDNTVVDHVVAANSTCVAVDLAFSGGATLRDSGATDQNGNRAHPLYQCGKLVTGQWNQVTVRLGDLFNGKAVTSLLIAYDQPAGTGGFRGYIDDISIAD